jgi:hypothetical protein
MYVDRPQGGYERQDWKEQRRNQEDLSCAQTLGSRAEETQPDGYASGQSSRECNDRMDKELHRRKRLPHARLREAPNYCERKNDDGHCSAANHRSH